MGICTSCLRAMVGAPTSTETEMVKQKAAIAKSKSNLQIDKSMTAPTIAITNDKEVSGSGLALVGVNVEQDAAYWEWHVDCDGSITNGDEEGGRALDEDAEIKFGVATKKNQQFYKALIANDEGEDVPMDDDGTSLMKSIPNLKSGDVIGVALQHSDLPMVQFLHNGEPLHHLAINRFRGAVFPSVW
eukprot:CAMPEP_0172520356 /NCGR_PEP_ID=MMETSP1066-20121228/291957_1 /TAXON_ID=671091 /ORGANISM="Coscinodiscus wailesii, Strain CCMP2513" /LENGTH=186 /DNA_ID=CAMNT_0013303099 /DNA_START=438 /DNA_END=995 /DNA_ORIENTATION=-